MTYEFDIKAYRKQMLKFTGFGYVIGIGIMLIIKPNYIDWLGYAWPMFLACFVGSTIGGIANCRWQREYTDDNFVSFETNNGHDEVIVRVYYRYSDAAHRVQTINKLRRGLTGAVVIRGVIENARIEPGSGKTKKRLVIQPYYKNMDGLFKDLERYQRQGILQETTNDLQI